MRELFNLLFEDVGILGGTILIVSILYINSLQSNNKIQFSGLSLL